MSIFKTNKTKFFALLTIILLGLFSLKLFAQDKEEEKSKLDQLKGKVEKITIKVDGKDVVFDGKEAEKMVDQLKAQKKTKIFSYGDMIKEEDSGDNVIIYKSKGDADGDVEVSTKNITKKVNVEDKDGKKVVTITTTKDGKEETKVYEGQEAEKFLKDEKETKHVKVFVEGDEGMPKDRVIYFNRSDENDGCCCCGKMKMGSKHGMKKIIIEKSDDNDKQQNEEKSEKK